MNSDQMDRLFSLEKSLATIETGNAVGQNIEQVWTLKAADIFKTDMEVLTEQEKRIAMRITDEANALAEVDGITVEQAQKQIDALVVVPVANTTANRLGI
jgi:hypothetical protein